MNDHLYELIFSKLDDLKDRIDACHDDVKATNARLERHIEEDQELANEVWFMKRAVQTTWGVVVAGVGLGLAWMGLGHQK